MTADYTWVCIAHERERCATCFPTYAIPRPSRVRVLSPSERRRRWCRRYARRGFVIVTAPLWAPVLWLVCAAFVFWPARRRGAGQAELLRPTTLDTLRWWDYLFFVVVALAGACAGAYMGDYWGP